MKFLVSWRVHDDKRHEALEVFSQMTPDDDKKELGGMKMIGRWHDLTGFTGVAVVETDDAKALANWLLNWNGIIDIESIPVFDDEEARAIGRARNA